MTDQDLIYRLRHSKGWPTLGNAAADRIEELKSKLAEAVAELKKLGEAGKVNGYVSSYIICHNCSDTHLAVDTFLAELKGQEDDLPIEQD